MPINVDPRASRRPRRRVAPRSRRTWILAAGVLGLAVLASGFLLISQPSNRQEGTCVFAFDASPATAAVHSQYEQWVAPMIQACASYRARIYALPVTSDTATDPIAPVDTSLAAIQGLGGSPQRDQERIQAAATGIVNQITTMISHADKSDGYTGTDLLALGPAVENLLHNPKDHLRQLVVFSDGLNARYPFNLTVIPLSDDAINQLVSQLRTEKQIPNLRGVTVQWYGAGIGKDADQLPDARLAAIEEFWRQYFTATGATLTTYARTP